MNLIEIKYTMEYGNLNIDDLKTLITNRSLELPKKGQGSGAKGAVIKADYVIILEDADAKPKKKRTPRSILQEPLRIIDLDTAKRTTESVAPIASFHLRRRFLENLEFLTKYSYRASAIFYLTDESSPSEEFARLFPRQRWILSKSLAIPSRKDLPNTNIILLSDITNKEVERKIYRELEPIAALLRFDQSGEDFEFFEGDLLYPVWGDSSNHSGTLVIDKEDARSTKYSVKLYTEILNYFYMNTGNKKYVIPGELKKLTKIGDYNHLIEARIVYDYVHRYHPNDPKQIDLLRKNLQ